MDGGAIFRVRDYARKAVTGDMTALRLHKNEVGGYTYNDAAVLCKRSFTRGRSEERRASKY